MVDSGVSCLFGVSICDASVILASKFNASRIKAILILHVLIIQKLKTNCNKICALSRSARDFKIALCACSHCEQTSKSTSLRLVCAFVVRMQQSQFFSQRGPGNICHVSLDRYNLAAHASL